MGICTDQEINHGFLYPSADIAQLFPIASNGRYSCQKRSGLVQVECEVYAVGWDMHRSACRPRVYVTRIPHKDLRVVILAHHSALVRSYTMQPFTIMCKRGRAKHGVKDDHAFVWKHAIFRHLPSRNQSTDQDEILHDILRRQGYAMYQKWLESVAWRRPTNR
jgi:hypothetical protein